MKMLKYYLLVKRCLNAEKEIIRLKERILLLELNRPVVYGDGFYHGYWKAREELADD